jgi:hypothetical protein
MKGETVRLELVRGKVYFRAALPVKDVVLDEDISDFPERGVNVHLVEQRPEAVRRGLLISLGVVDPAEAPHVVLYEVAGLDEVPV